MVTLGLPQVIINFTSQAATAITRSSRGVVALIMNDGNVSDDDGVIKYTITDTTDIPTDISDSNVDLIKKCLLGTPLKVYALMIPPATHNEEREVSQEVEVQSDVVVTDSVTGATDTVTSTVTVTQTTTQTVVVNATVTQATALKSIANARVNYICHPTGTAQDQQDLATWVKLQRNNRRRTCKAVVANHAADSQGVINFTTKGIKLVNPAYADALELADGDEVDVPQYLTYTTTQYTARIAGILAGVSLDRSVTYYELPEVVSVDEYNDIDASIDNGELCLFDEQDDNGVKIARGVNSLVTFTSETGSDFRFIKNIEGIDLIQTDIAENFKNNYLGKVLNSYDNKQLFISAVHTYFSGLAGTVLDPNADNHLEIDAAANLDYAKSQGADVDNLTEAQILQYPTGVNVFLTGSVKLLNTMEDLKLTISLD